MKLSQFSYELPEELIAQYPLNDRDASRMMVVDRAKGTITDDYFKNISEFLPGQIQFVFNDSKVIPARLIGVKEITGAAVEIPNFSSMVGKGSCLANPRDKIKFALS